MLTWLKSWDKIVFGREVAQILPVATRQFYGSNHKPFPGASTITQQKPQQYQQYQPPEYNHNRLLLLSGPPGCGKTTLARIVAKHCGYEIMELNASDDRSGRVLIEKLESLGKNNSVLNNKPTMIVVDEVDGALEQDGNGIKEVLAYLQSGGKAGDKDKEK